MNVNAVHSIWVGKLEEHRHLFTLSLYEEHILLLILNLYLLNEWVIKIEEGVSSPFLCKMLVNI